MREFKSIKTFIIAACFVNLCQCLGLSLGQDSAGEGCTAPYLLPGKPFVVVWNQPSQICEKQGVTIDFEKWGIVANPKSQFIGEHIALLYRPGEWPFYLGKKTYNGGIPQAGNLTLHIQSLTKTIESEIKSRDFSGLGVIDFEKWRPLYFLNFDSLKIYQEKSIERVKKEHPQYNKSEVLREAIKEFEKAARSFIEDSLKTARKLRPNGQWGYYGYPRCWDENCNSSTVSINDRMAWVFAASQGLYPSIYFDLCLPEPARREMVIKRLLETLRVKAKWAPQEAAIFPYALCQDRSHKLFSKADLHYSVELPAEIGSSGVLLWGSSQTLHAKNECLVLRDYVNSTLGPFSKKVMDFFAACSVSRCSKHGRCVRKDFEAAYQHHLSDRGQEKCKIDSKKLELRQSSGSVTRDFYTTSDGYEASNVDKIGIFDDYVCKCNVGWSGVHCDIR